jgi:hypothetical protein
MVYIMQDWFVIALFALLVVIIIAQFITIRILMSFRPPREHHMPPKQEMKNLSFKDMR